MITKYKFKNQGADCIIFDYPTNSPVILLCVPSFKGGAFQFFLLRRGLKKLGIHVITLNFSFRWLSKNMFANMSLSKGKEELEFIVNKVRSLYPFKKIVLFGQSFGGSICISVKQQIIDGIILSSPVLDIEETLRSYFKFKDIEELGKKKFIYFWEPINFPIKLLRLSVKSKIIKDAIKNFNLDILAKKITSPILIFYGEKDKRLSGDVLSIFWEKIKSTKKEISVVRGGSHNALSFWFSTKLSVKIYLFL
ncbi:MAG: hypothetical protein AAB693_00115, partial [Patescibacteria group bacterium]